MKPKATLTYKTRPLAPTCECGQPLPRSLAVVVCADTQVMDMSPSLTVVVVCRCERKLPVEATLTRYEVQ